MSYISSLSYCQDNQSFCCSSPLTPDWLVAPKKEPYECFQQSNHECPSICPSHQSCQFVLEIGFKEATQKHIDWNLV